jgi:hypothetical protein
VILIALVALVHVRQIAIVKIAAEDNPVAELKHIVSRAKALRASYHYRLYWL